MMLKSVDLPAPFGADDPAPLACGDGKADVFEHAQTAEALVDVLERETLAHIADSRSAAVRALPWMRRTMRWPTPIKPSGAYMTMMK